MFRCEFVEMDPVPVNVLTNTVGMTVCDDCVGALTLLDNWRVVGIERITSEGDSKQSNLINSFFKMFVFGIEIWFGNLNTEKRLRINKL